MRGFFVRVFSGRISALFEKAEGGIFKRIDENRELAIMLYKHAPDFLRDNPQAVRILQSQDCFMSELAKQPIYKAERCLFKPRKGLPRSLDFDALGKAGRR